MRLLDNQHRLSLLGLVLAAGVVLASCAPTGGGGARSGEGDAAASGSQKVLRIAMQAQAEPTDGIFGVISGSTLGGSSAFEHELTFHSELTTLDPDTTLQPRLATQVPSLTDGSWQVFPDGRMEVTFKLRPNVFWHDGTALKADDFVFGTKISKDTTLAATPRALGTRLLTEVVAPDDQTVVVHYPQPYVNANVGLNTPALPRHILTEAYERGEPQAFQIHPYWTTEFVGLGPYRLAGWQQASFMEGVAFDRYFLGKPKTERILIRYYGDVNTMIAALLAGDIDVIPAGAQLDADQLATINNAWRAEGKGTVQPVPKGTRNIIPQMRDQSLPWTRDVRVRQAMAHATDRQLIVDTLQYGLTTVAHTSITPRLPAFRMLEERGLPKFDYDPARAERLLNDAGWTRGANRVFQNSGGQAFQADITASAQADNIKEAETITAQWSSFGFQSKPTPYPAAVAPALAMEIRMTYPNILIWPASSLNNALEGFASESIGTEANRWRGRNYGGYSNPAFDAAYAKYAVTLDPMESQALIADMMKIAADDVAAIPIYYAALGLAYVKGVEGPGAVSPDQAANAWNIHEWTIR